jgi:WD40 repeat protein
MQLWDLELDVAVSEESDRIVPLGSGVVARYDDDRQSGEPRLERVKTGEEILLRIPGSSKHLELSGGTSASPAFAWWPGPEGKVIPFDPSTGEPLGPPLAIPSQIDGVDAVSESPDSGRAVVTWFGPAQAMTETAVFDIATGKLLVRGLDGLDSSLVINEDELIGITNDTVRRYDIRTLEPVSALAKSVGGGALLALSSDGRTLLNVGFNNSLTLYDLTTDIALAGPIDSAVDGTRLPGGYLTANGETLLEALPDGIRVWDLRPSQQASSACALAGRELSDVEWSTYFPSEPQIATCAALAD